MDIEIKDDAKEIWMDIGWRDAARSPLTLYSSESTLFYYIQYLKLPLWIFSELKEQKEFNKH
jgi:hypothetical protein